MYTEVTALPAVLYLKFLKQLSSQDFLEMEKTLQYYCLLEVEECHQSKFTNDGLRSNEVK